MSDPHSLSDPHPTPEPYPSLFRPIELGPRTARNRIWMTAHATEFGDGHTFSDQSADYYEERARGGVAAITMEAMAVHPTSRPRPNVVFAYSADVVASYRKMAAAVHPHGTMLFAQLWHRGRQSTSAYSRLPTWAPSAVPDTVYREIPHAMTEAEIDDLVAHYVTSARHAAEGGLDGVEVHGLAHGYMIGQFLSPATNHRTDDYGGPLVNRMRILRRIVDGIREVLPERMVLGVRINSNDGPVEHGLDNAAWVEIAAEMARWDVFHYMSTSQGTYLDRMLIYGTSGTKPAGYEVADTARIKAAVGDLPVIAVGRITTPEMAEDIIASGQADMVGMARQLIADPTWPAKAKADRSTDIRPCVGANWCLVGTGNGAMTCLHNPEVGHEREFRTLLERPTPRRRAVAVVGGGPAGLRAALTAAGRGHDVTLFERRDQLGGQVAMMARAPSYGEWLGITDWLSDRIEHAGVRVVLSHEATADELRAGFDTVVVAAGSDPVRHGWTAAHPWRWSAEAPAVPGTDQWNVLTPVDVLTGAAEVLDRVLVVDDLGDRQALAVAEYLAERRHSVHVVTGHPQLGAALTNSHDLPATIGALRRRGVTVTTNHELTAIDEDRASLTDVHTGETVTETADTVVLVLGGAANDALGAALRDDDIEVHLVGDCLAPRRIADAIWEGERVALNL